MRDLELSFSVLNKRDPSLMNRAPRFKLIPDFFSFMGLPKEIRFMIYEYYYATFRGLVAGAVYCGERGKYRMSHLPDLRIERASKEVSRESRRIRATLPMGLDIDRCAIFHGTGQHPSSHVYWDDLASLFRASHTSLSYTSLPKQLRINITILRFDIPESGIPLIDWDSILHSLPRLQEITIWHTMRQPESRKKSALVKSFMKGGFEKRPSEWMKSYKLEELRLRLLSPHHSRKMALNIIHLPDDTTDDVQFHTTEKNMAETNGEVSNVYTWSPEEGPVKERQERVYRR